VHMYLLNALIFNILISNSFATTEATDVLLQVGFSGLYQWLVGIIALIATVTISFAVARVFNRSASHISTGSSSSNSPNSKSSNKKQPPKPVYVNYGYRSKIVYHVRYRLNEKTWATHTQTYQNLSLQFDWKSFNWHITTRGYYKNKSMFEHGGLSLNNSKFSGRVFDFNKGVWKYELRKQEDLLFHSSLNLNQKNAINTFLEKVTKIEDRQAILNLLGNQIDWRLKSGKQSIDKPDIYLGSLVKKYLAGSLDLSSAKKSVERKEETNKTNVGKSKVIAQVTIGDQKKLKKSQALLDFLVRVSEIKTAQDTNNMMRELNYGQLKFSSSERDIAAQEIGRKSLELSTQKTKQVETVKVSNALGESSRKDNVVENVKRDDFSDKPSLDVDEINMLFTSAASEQFH